MEFALTETSQIDKDSELNLSNEKTLNVYVIFPVCDHHK